MHIELNDKMMNLKNVCEMNLKTNCNMYKQTFYFKKLSKQNDHKKNLIPIYEKSLLS